MKAYIEKENCSGCTACVNCCPKKALVMKPDEEGFLYPVTDESICNNCGICRKICAFDNSNNKNDNPVVYAAIHKSKEVVGQSSSGGLFTALSDYVLHNNGVVYGAAFNEDYTEVLHLRAEDIHKRNLLRGSKYIQSDLKDNFIRIKEDLTNNKTVLFTGTPCQTAGLKKYLETKRISQDNLILCDIICHGTPSSMIWKDYVKELQEQNGGKISSFSFRSKNKGWRDYSISVTIKNTDISRECNRKFSFLQLFQNYAGLLRPSCYNCKFTNYNRPSDITIGDFWNIELSKPQMDDNTGVSLVLLNTSKGQEIFHKIEGKLEYEKSNKEECFQAHLLYPSRRPKNRDEFWLEYKEKGIAFVIKKYAKGTYFTQFKRFVMKFTRKIGLYNFIAKRYIIRMKKEG